MKMYKKCIERNEKMKPLPLPDKSCHRNQRLQEWES